jgi:hypothetical protein
VTLLDDAPPAPSGVRPRWAGYLRNQTADTFDLDTYLLELDSELLAVPEGRRVLTELDPLLFALTYLSHHLKSPATRDQITLGDAHLDWCRQAREWVVPASGPREQRDAYIAPREMGKSTWFYLVLPLWAAAHGHRKFIAAFADSGTQAEMHLQTFKNELENNSLLQRDFPELCEPATRYRGATQSDTKGLTIRKSGFVFGARGADSKTLGMKVGERRPDMLILDDIEPGEDQYSEYQVTGRLTTITDVIFALSEYARVVIVGTVTMPGSIIHQLVKSVTEPDGDIPDWIAEQRIRVHYYAPIVVDDDGQERSIWPAKWSMAYLNAIRHTRSFLKNFANSPLGMDGDYWSLEDFQYGEVDGKTRVMLSIDPAGTTKTTSDWTGLAVVGWAPPVHRADPRRQPVDDEDIRLQVLGSLGVCEVMHAKAVKLVGNRLRDEVLRVLEMFPEIGLVIVEANKEGEHWYDILHHLPCKLQIFNQSVDKKVRAAQALAHYQRGRVYHTQRLSAVEEQMVSFPKAPNDDMVDAVGSAVTRLLKRPTKQGGSVKAVGGWA